MLTVRTEAGTANTVNGIYDRALEQIKFCQPREQYTTMSEIYYMPL